jgi:hypothetical protein
MVDLMSLDPSLEALYDAGTVIWSKYRSADVNTPAVFAYDPCT